MPMHNIRPPRPEHIEGVVKALSDGKLHSTKWIVKTSGLTLTATKGAVAYLERTNKLKVVYREKSPKVIVALRKTPPKPGTII